MGENNGYLGLIINITDPRITAKNNQFPCTMGKSMKTILLVMLKYSLNLKAAKVVYGMRSYQSAKPCS